MNILIRGMEMPTSCDKCRFCVNGFTDDAPMYECAVQSYENVSVLVESGGKPFDFRPDWCSLIEIPTPHGRLVDLDKMVDEYWDGSSMRIGKTDIKDIEEYDTVIEAEGSEK